MGLFTNPKNKMLTTLYEGTSIPAAYSSTDDSTSVVRVAAGQPLVFYAHNVGTATTNDVTADLAFMPYESYVDESTPYNPAPPAGNAANWYTLSDIAGGPLGDAEIVFVASTGAGTYSLVNTADREAVTDGTGSAAGMWRGYVPQGAGWLRVRLKAAGAPTSFELKMSNDNRGYING